MGKLRSLKPAVSTLAPAIGRSTKPDGHDIDAEPWRRWYWTKRWRDLRLFVFRRDRWRCQMCDLFEHNTARLIGDHIEPHNGNPDLFWDPDNVQTLCPSCHSGPKQKMEKAGHLPDVG